MTEEEIELRKQAYEEIENISDSIKAKKLDTLKALPLRGVEYLKHLNGDEEKKLYMGWFRILKPELPGIFKDESSMVSIQINPLGEAVKQVLEEALEKLPETEAHAKATVRSLYNLLNYLADSPYPLRLASLPQDCIDLKDSAINMGWVKQIKLSDIGPLLILTPEGEAEIARYHRVSSAFYDMNLSEKIKC